MVGLLDLRSSSTRPSRYQDPQIILSQEHPDLVSVSEDLSAGNDRYHESTFELGLTPDQKSARDGVILPYFDAQAGSGAGGRILYELDREDDFDEEEDETR